MFQSERRVGLLLVVLSAVGYSFLPIFGRSIYAISDFQPIDVALWRFLFATPVIWLMIGLRGSVGPRGAVKVKQGADGNPAPTPFRQLFGLGLLYAAAALCAFFGLQLISASLYVVLFYTYPAFVALISLLTGERLSLRAWVAVGLTLVGVVLTVPNPAGISGGDWRGMLIAILNALVVALYFRFSADVLRRTRTVAYGTAWVMTSTLLILLVLIPFVGLRIPQELNVWLNLMGLGVVSTAVPIFAVNLGIQKVGAPQAAIISAFEPVVAIVLAMLLLGEFITFVQGIGAAVIILAVVLLELRGHHFARLWRFGR